MPMLPSKFFKGNFWNFPFTSFPTSWEDFENLDYAWNQPGLTVSEDSNSFYVEAQMPGLNKNEINVTVDSGVLHIDGSRKEEEKSKDRKYYRKSSYNFSYRLSLPGQVDENSPKATYKDGIMQITFKKQKQSQGKKITVQGG